MTETRHLAALSSGFLQLCSRMLMTHLFTGAVLTPEIEYLGVPLTVLALAEVWPANCSSYGSMSANAP